MGSKLYIVYQAACRAPLCLCFHDCNAKITSVDSVNGFAGEEIYEAPFGDSPVDLVVSGEDLYIADSFTGIWKYSPNHIVQMLLPTTTFTGILFDRGMQLYLTMGSTLVKPLDLQNLRSFQILIDNVQSPVVDDSNNLYFFRTEPRTDESGSQFNNITLVKVNDINNLAQTSVALMQNLKISQRLFLDRYDNLIFMDYAASSAAEPPSGTSFYNVSGLTGVLNSQQTIDSLDFYPSQLINSTLYSLKPGPSDTNYSIAFLKLDEILLTEQILVSFDIAALGSSSTGVSFAIHPYNEKTLFLSLDSLVYGLNFQNDSIASVCLLSSNNTPPVNIWLNNPSSSNQEEDPVYLYILSSKGVYSQDADFNPCAPHNMTSSSPRSYGRAHHIFIFLLVSAFFGSQYIVSGG
jgi:hypothetical protein